jgi:voltage-gated sodium channel
MTLRERLRQLEGSAWFHRLTVGVIVFAAVLIGIETDARLVGEHLWAFGFLDRAILVYFLFEISVRIAAHGRAFFRSGWNWFDLTVVSVCLLPVGTGYMAAVRLLRVLRVLRLLTAFPKLQVLVSALFKSLPSMGYVVLLMGILFYVYAVIGTKLFGATDPVHFGNLARSGVSLFQVVTLEGWADLMNVQRLDSGSAAIAWIAPAYFISFILFGTMITLNLLIGVIINSMQESHKEIHAAAAASQPDSAVKRLEEIQAQLSRMQENLDVIRLHLSDRKAAR